MTQTQLRLSPYVYGKIMFLREHCNDEIAGFGISEKETPLNVFDVLLVNQRRTRASVEFDDDAVAEFFDMMVDKGYHPSEFARIWIHTHPGMSATPSAQDWTTFDYCFGRTDWAVMCIFGESQMFGQLHLRTPFAVNLTLPVAIDWSLPFFESDQKGWLAELNRTEIKQKTIFYGPKKTGKPSTSIILGDANDSPLTEEELAEIRAAFALELGDGSFAVQGETTGPTTDWNPVGGGPSNYIPELHDIVFHPVHGKCRVIECGYWDVNTVDLQSFDDETLVYNSEVAEISLMERKKDESLFATA